ncbi:hypothetical protein JVT61DRAFT_3945 [Boletus reticuloceps]|uniref:Uncharacterized protein n=1 Tax=Boletus reticuloceps TaxID=495285 RepID=A0A8I2YL02_9AGAM|nr:hypothetical protein JVT61DRAFT_3945 [Boletus reticuloceps]
MDMMSNSFSIDTCFWPCMPHNRQPLMGSKQVQELTYGKAHMHQSMAQPINRPIALDPYAYNNDLLLHVFEVALKVYIEDIKNLVQSVMEEELRVLANSGDYVLRNSHQMWLKSKNPLSYKKDDFPHLLTALDPTRNNNGVTFSLEAPLGEDRPVSYFMAKIINGVDKRREPLFIQDSMFQHVVSAAMEVLSRLGACLTF